jgi:hypothetical protein
MKFFDTEAKEEIYLGVEPEWVGCKATLPTGLSLILEVAKQPYQLG